MGTHRVRWGVGVVAAAVVTAVTVGRPADPVGTAAAWPLDEVALANGARCRGLILKEGLTGIDFQVVQQVPGRPTVLLTTFFARREVAGVKRLSDADRAVLKEKLADIGQQTGTGERRQMDALDLTPADWLGRPGAAKRYASDRFVLVSGAPDEVTRKAAVRLEQIYAAFARVLPPRHPGGRPTRVLLAGRMDEYAELIGAAAGPLLNPAFYDPAANQIVCGSDLRRLGEEYAANGRLHRDELARLRKYEAEVRQLYKGPGTKADRDRFLGLALNERQRIDQADRANGAKFDAATRRLFALLYHEAFHSYAATFVYPPVAAADVRAGTGTGELPRWLNEGLAQIFETAVVEGGELRVGHADADRLDRVRDLVRGKGGAGLVPVAELLRAGKESFLTAHAGQAAAADRAYLTSWAVAFHLTFDRRAVGTPAFEQYLRAVNGGGNPVAAFEGWVGQDVPGYEKDLHDYLARLLPDGTAPPAVGRRP